MQFAIIVTGSAGFIGSHMCEYLLRLNNVVYVVGIDNFCTYTGMNHVDTLALKMSNQKSFISNKKFELISKDIIDVDFALLCNQIRSKTSIDVSIIVIHLAASAGVRASIMNPKDYASNNVKATASLLEGSVKGCVSSVILASSSSVYGNRPDLSLNVHSSSSSSSVVSFSEKDCTDFPISPYAATKKSTELLGYTFHINHGINIGCVRLFSVYGPRQRPDLVMHKFMSNILNGKPIDIYGDGSMERDFTYVTDVVEGIWNAAKTIYKFGYKIWNIGNSSPIRISDLVDKIVNVVCVDELPSVRYLPVPEGDVERTCANITLASYDLGYCPKYSIEKGILEEWKWICSINKQTHVHECKKMEEKDTDNMCV